MRSAGAHDRALGLCFFGLDRLRFDPLGFFDRVDEDVVQIATRREAAEQVDVLGQREEGVDEARHWLCDQRNQHGQGHRHERSVRSVRERVLGRFALGQWPSARWSII